MIWKISSTDKSKIRLLTIALVINYCASLYWTLSNQLVGKFIAVATLLCSLLHACLYVYFNRRKKTIIYWGLLYIIIFIVYRYCRRREVLDLYTYVSYYGTIEYRILNKRVKYVTEIFVGAVVLLNVVHLLPSAPLFYRDGLLRYTFGFNHPNAGGYYLYIIASTIFAEAYNNVKIKDIFQVIIFGFLSYYIFNCRTSTIAIIIIMAVMLIKAIKMSFLTNFMRMKLCKNFWGVIPILIVVVLLYISKHYQDYQYLNRLLSARVENNALYLKQYTIKLWGNANVPTWLLAEDNWGMRYLDSGYMQCLLSLGLFNFVVYLSLLITTIKRNVKYKSAHIVILLEIIALMLIVESAPLRWYFSIPILYRTCYSKHTNR